MTQDVGSPLWMAPELILSTKSNRLGMPAENSGQKQDLKYGEEVDVYSFGVITFEIIALREPFHDCNFIGEVAARVERGERPQMGDADAPPMELLDIPNIMNECWTQDPELRPTFESVRNRLQALQMQFQMKVPFSGPVNRLHSLRSHSAKFHILRAHSKTRQYGSMNE